nr:hypothetical protein [Tanacetum cinerariifolium]
IKQFWTTVAVKKVNHVTRLQALVDKKKVVVTEATIKEALHLDDAEGIECLPNEEIFAELARMGYEKPFTKITFYKVGKGFSGVETPLFKEMIVEQQVAEGDAHEVHGEDVNAGDTVEGDVSTANDEEPSIPSPTPPTPPSQPSHDILSTSQVKDVPADNAKDDQDADVEKSAHNQGRQAESQAEIYKIDLEHANKVLSMQEAESVLAELQEVVDVVTTAKLITEAVTAASTTITAADIQIPAATTAAATVLTVSPSRRTKGVLIRDPEENFNIEDLEALWRLVKEKFSTAKPKNFSDDYLLITLRAMFKKPDIHAQIWKNQRSVHGQAKVKSWKLLE